MKVVVMMFMVLMCSCMNEEINQRFESGSKTICFSLVNTSSSVPFTKGTRAIDALYPNEKVINKLQILLYDEMGTTCLFYPEQKQVILSGTDVQIIIPEQVAEEKLIGQSLQVYVLANCELDREYVQASSLLTLKQQVLDNQEDRSFNRESAPIDFVMDSEVLQMTFDGSQNQDLGKITLKRAAAKIIVDISNAVIAGYTPGNATVTLTNYLDKTRLGREYQYDPITSGTDGDYKDGVRALTANNDDDKTYFMDAANPLYSYSNDWSVNMEGETYVTIALEWTNNDSNDKKVYYYRIPFQFIGGAGNIEGNQYKLRRNFVYQFLVNVTQLGGLDPESALELRANFDIIDWTTLQLDASLVQFDFLYVYNPFVDLYNKADYKWEYKSSKPISFEIEKVMCNYYEPSGDIKVKHYTPGDPQYPTITDLGEEIVGSGKSYFSLSSIVPINYVPLFIYLNVKNSANMLQEVVLVIYPPRYVTAQYSTNSPYIAGAWEKPDSEGNLSGGPGIYGNNRPEGNSSMTNFNLFTVSTTSLTLQDMNKGYKVGDPTTLIKHPLSNWKGIDYYQTLTTEEANKVISPQFVVASQRGITNSREWDKQQERCASYREAPYLSGTWRMPTTAELEIISAMQRDENSAIKNLFVPTGSLSYWWAAEAIEKRNHRAVNLATGATTSSSGSQSVRCVHDVWRDSKQ
ncbi:MAG: hypothetical protein ACRCS7_15545 [Tannerellaceae bacterium]